MEVTGRVAFAGVMDLLREGSQEAAAEVHRRFVDRLVALAERQFDSRLLARADFEGVVQSAFRSFFRRYGEGQYDLGHWGAVWRMLAVITVRKCSKRRDYLRAGRRDARREAGAVGRDDAPIHSIPDREPTPEEAAMLAETVLAWLDRIDSNDREVIRLGLLGLEDPDIAARLHRSERTVRRVRQRAEERLLALIARGDALE